MGDDHVPEGAGLLVGPPGADPMPRVSGTSIWMWSMCWRFQIGSNRPLAKRKARMFWAASFARKWSMRNTWSSSKTSWTTALSRRALGRSVPKGFSMMMRARSVSPASPRVCTTTSAAWGGMLR